MTTPITTPASEVRMMDSAHTGRRYRISISLPLAYAPPAGEVWPFNDPPDQWPVVYVVDGNWYAGAITDMLRPMAWCGGTSDAIVVSIGYGESNDPVEWVRETFTRRNADLTPVRTESEEKGMEAHHGRPAPTGDSANFLKFMQHELMPMIEREYRVDPAQQIFVGHSYGGLFGLFALFEAPDLFAKLVLGSPTLSYGERWMFHREEAFAKEGKPIPAKIYLFAAENEEALDDTTLTDTLRFATILQARKYEGLSLVKQVFLDQNHCEVAVPGFQWGLKNALKKG